MTFEVGDRLKVSFYERLAMEDDKYATTKTSSRSSASFYLHPELSGEYTVQADWAVTFPMIGRLLIAHQTTEDVEKTLTGALDKLLHGNTGFVNVALVERAPIYVIGPVKQPGVYKYAAGLMPWNAVALAGGLLRGDEDKWSIVEAVRSASKLAATTDRLARAWARYAVLQAELNGHDVSAPEALINLVGAQRATQLLVDEQQKQAPVTTARIARQKSLDAAVDAARKVVDIDTKRQAPVQDSVAQRQSRFAALQTLQQRGGIDNIQLAQARGELSDAQERQAGVEAALAQDQQRLALAQSTVAQFDADTKADLNTQLAALQRDIDDLTPDAAANTGVIRLMQPTPAVTESAVHFKIIRQSQIVQANDTTLLQPGDLLMVQSDQSSSAVGTGSDYQFYLHSQALR